MVVIRVRLDGIPLVAVLVKTAIVPTQEAPRRVLVSSGLWNARLEVQRPAHHRGNNRPRLQGHGQPYGDRVVTSEKVLGSDVTRDIGRGLTQDLSDCESVGEVTVGIPECLEDAQRRAVRNAIHGTIVAESVIDIAPEVSLYIANPISRADLQAAADWMVSEDVSVINHSVGWTFDGPGDGTSPLSASPLNTVDRAVANDILWVNSAGNSAQETWFGGYSDPDDDKFINFISGNYEVNRLSLRACRSYRVQLRWEDDWNGACTDLDLYLYHIPSRTFTTDYSEDEQSGQSGHVPFETFFFSPNPPKDTDGRREDSGRVGEGATGEMAGLHWGRLEVGGRSSVAA